MQLKRKTIRLAQEGKKRRIKLNLRNQSKKTGFSEAEVCYVIEASHLIQEGVMITQMNNQFGFSFPHMTSESYLEDRGREVTVVIT